MVTVTGNFEGLTGTGTGYVVISLINYANNVPRVSGTGVIINPVYQSSTGSSFSTTLWGNDAITPSNTYYQVDYYTGTTLISSGVYQFIGSGSYDLSTTSPVVVQPTQPLGYGYYIPVLPANIVPSGAVDGTNTVFSFTAAPAPTPLIFVFLDGVLQANAGAADYSLAYAGSNTWTVTFTAAPVNGPVTILMFGS